MRTWIVGIAAVACLACGDGGGETTTATTTTGNVVNGTIDGTYTLAAKDAVFNVGDWSIGAPVFDGPSTGVVISDFGSLCGYESQDQAPPNTQTLTLALGMIDTNGNASAATATGDYVIPPLSADYRAPNTLRAAVWWEFAGPSCSGAAAENGSNGNGHVLLTAVSAARIAGTFDVVFTTGDHVTGSFDAPSCSGVNLNRRLSCPP
jgi:hypothetical protein